MKVGLITSSFYIALHFSFKNSLLQSTSGYMLLVIDTGCLLRDIDRRESGTFEHKWLNFITSLVDDQSIGTTVGGSTT